MEGGRNVAEKGEIVGDAGWSGEVGEVDEGDVKEVGAVERLVVGGGGPLEVDVSDANREISTVGERITTTKLAGRGPREGCFEGRDGFLEDGCGHGVSQGGEK